MVDMQFVGDVNELCDEQKLFIINVLKERGFKNEIIDIQAVGKAGDNYVASVKRITVKNGGESFKMIAKVAPKNEMMRAIDNTALLFQNEDIMYNRVLPKFVELEKAVNIPEEERLRYAACYGTYMEAPNEIILLEDLEVPGFKMLDRFISLTDENVRLVLKNFATLHSLSYALKYQEPETFETFCNSLVNFWSLMGNSPETYTWLAQIDADVQVLLHDDKYKNAVKNVAVQIITEATEQAKLDKSSKYSVIQQGDPWTNNILFRLENDKTVECCMIDYQISKQCNPAGDLLYMIFNCTDHATRTKYYHDWMDYYHAQLDKNFANYNLKACNVYPRDQLDADLRRFAKISLGQSVVLSTMLARNAAGATEIQQTMNTIDGSSTAEDFADIAEKIRLSNADSETIMKFKVRVEELVESFITFEYL